MGQASSNAKRGKNLYQAWQRRVAWPVAHWPLGIGLLLQLPGCIVISVDPPISQTGNVESPTAAADTQTLPLGVDAGPTTLPAYALEGGAGTFDSTPGSTAQSDSELTFTSVGTDMSTTKRDVADASALPDGTQDGGPFAPTSLPYGSSSASTDTGYSTAGTCDGSETWRCAADGNVYRFDSCGQSLAKLEECPGDCIEEGAAARCRCVVYVGRTGSDQEPDGRSWNSGFRNLWDALDAARQRGNCELWVSEGTYSIEATQMQEFVDMYGGFATDMVRRTQRNPAIHVTVLDATEATNELGCLLGADHATLDGFTISGARVGAMVNNGVSPTIRNCKFLSNRVVDVNGALVNINGAAPLIEATAFIENKGLESGPGALLNQDSAPVFRACTFENNRFLLTETNSSSRFESCTFLDNWGIRFENSVIINSLFSGTYYNDRTPITGENVYVAATVFSANETADYTSARSAEAFEFSGVVANSVFMNHRSDVPIVRMYGEASLFANNAFTGNTSGENPISGSDDSACVLAEEGSLVANTAFGDPAISALHPSSTGLLSYSFLREGSCATCNQGDPGLVAIQNSTFFVADNPSALDSGSRLLLPPDGADLDNDGDTEEPLPIDALGRARVAGPEIDVGPVEGY